MFKGCVPRDLSFTDTDTDTTNYNITLLSFFKSEIFSRVGGTAGAIVTCPLEVVKTRLQSSNSGFDTSLKLDKTGEVKKCGNNCSKQNFAGKVSHGVYRPALGSNYTISVHQLLNANCGHFGSSTPILYSTQSQPCRPLQSKLSAFGDRTKAKSVHTGQAVLQSRTPGAAMGVWACLK